MKFSVAVLLAFLAVAGTATAQAQDELVVQSGPRGAVRTLAVSPDGSRLACLSKQLVQVWTCGGGVLWSEPVEGGQTALAWSPDGRKLAIGTGGDPDFTVSRAGDSAGARELDASNGRLLRTLLKGNNSTSELDYDTSGALAVVSPEGRVLWNAAGEATTPAMAPVPPPTLSAPSFDGAVLHLPAGQAKPRVIRLLPAALSPKNESEVFAASAVDPAEKSVLCARTDFPHAMATAEGDLSGPPRTFLWRVDLGTGHVQTLRNGTAGALTALAFWPDGTAILGGATGPGREQWEGDLHFASLNATGLRSLWQAPPSLEAALTARFSPDGQHLAVGGDDTAIRIWNTATGRLDETFKELSSSIPALAYSPDGTRLAALDYRNLFVWDCATRKAAKFPGTEALQGCSLELSWSPDGRRLALGGGADVKIWDGATGRERSLLPAGGAFAPLRWTASGLWVAAGTYSPLQLRDPASGRLLGFLSASGPASERSHDGPVAAFQFFAGGRRLWTLGGDGQMSPLDLKRWDVPRARVERTLSAVAGPRCFALSPDEKTLAVGDGQGIHFFESETLRATATSDFGVPVNSLVWNVAGTRLVAAGGDGWTRLLDAGGAEISRFTALPPLRPAGTGYEWLCLAADGTFISSAKAAPQLRWRHAGALLPFGEHAAHAREALSVFGAADSAPASAAAGHASGGAPASKAAFGASAGQRQTPADGPHPKPDARPSATAPLLVVQGADGSSFGALAVSDGGRWIASSQNDRKPARLWDGPSGLQWGGLPGTAGLAPLLFTPDGRRLLLADDGTHPTIDVPHPEIALYAVPSGRRLRSFSLPPAPLWTDGKRLRGIKDGRLIEFDLDTGQLRASHPLQGARPAANFAFSPNGAFICSGGTYQTDPVARVWRAADGKLIGQVRDKLRVIGRAAISSDGKLLATEGDDPNWSPPGPNDFSSEASFARSFKIHIWNLATRKVIRTFPGYYSLDGGARLLRFAVDGATLLGASSGAFDRFDLRTGKAAQLPPARRGGRRSLQAPTAVSPDGKWLAGSGYLQESGGYSQCLQLWNVAVGTLKNRFASGLHGAQTVHWSPDGSWLAGSNPLVVWDARTGEARGQAGSSNPDSWFWLDNQTIRGASFERMAQWSVPAATQLASRELGIGKSKDPWDGYHGGASLSPDGRLLLTGDPKGEPGNSSSRLFVRDARTLAVLREVKAEKGSFGTRAVDGILWVPDGRRILRVSNTGCELLNVETGLREALLRDPVDPDFATDASGQKGLLPLAISADGRLAALRASRDQSIWIYDLAAAKFTVQLIVRAGYRAQFLRDNHTLVLDGDTGLEWWDAGGNGASAVRILRGVPRGQWEFSPDNSKVVFATDGAGSSGVEVWDVAKGRKALTLYLAGGGAEVHPPDWIALTPEGIYDASPGGEKRLRWREGVTFWPLEKSRARFRNPAKIAAALN